MTMLRRSTYAVLAATFLVASAVHSTSFSVDQSDLYYIQAEPGWGIELVQRGSVIFGTMFVYDPSSTPTWYVSTLQSTGDLTWTGDLYATTGPYFGTVPFDATKVVPTKVGTMTWTAQSTNAGTLTYTVNGVAVTKNVVRQTIVADDYSGTYLGALHGAATGCTNPSSDTPPFDVPSATIAVTQHGQSIGIVISAFGTSVVIPGTLTQNGQFGDVVGTYTSTVGEAGNANVSAMNVQVNSLTASFSLNSTNNGCRTAGYVVGMRSRP